MLLFNHRSSKRNTCISTISKHLMLLFNWGRILKALQEVRFQNISCYCLTTDAEREFVRVDLFQNISCYCLTHLFPMCSFNFFQFQNISCYCLTTFRASKQGQQKLFQNISCYCLTKRSEATEQERVDFKTSHVIV